MNNGVPLAGNGKLTVKMPIEDVYRTLLDPNKLIELTPLAQVVERVKPNHYTALVGYSFGPIKNQYKVDLMVSIIKPGRVVSLKGECHGKFVDAWSQGIVKLEPISNLKTSIEWNYTGFVKNRASAMGSNLLSRTADFFIGRFFTGLHKITTKL